MMQDIAKAGAGDCGWVGEDKRIYQQAQSSLGSSGILSWSTSGKEPNPLKAGATPFLPPDFPFAAIEMVATSPRLVLADENSPKRDRDEAMVFKAAEFGPKAVATSMKSAAITIAEVYFDWN